MNDEPRVPFTPPYFQEDLPHLDALHAAVGLSKLWMASSERAEIAYTFRPPEGAFVCFMPGCYAFVKNDRWSKTKAEGWFFLKDDKAWCPKHVPQWVAGWRKKKG